LQAVVWVHPTVLTILWAQEIVFCTRMPAGEIDRGTIDLLMSWPVSRRVLFLSDGILWAFSGAVLLCCGLVGHRLATWMARTQAQPPMQVLGMILANLYAVYLTVGGVAYLVSSLSNRRGMAMAVVFGLLLASFVQNFLAQFWPLADWLSPVGILSYYRPAEILTTGICPTRDILLLSTVGAVTWLAGCEIFARRNILTA